MESLKVFLSSLGDKINAEQVHHQLTETLEKLSTLKPSKPLYNTVTKFVTETEELIDKGYYGDWKALDHARSNIRWMDALYHSSPRNARIKTPFGSGVEPPKNAQELLAALQPAVGWRKYRELIMTTAITAAVTEAVTITVLFLVHLI